MGQIIIFSEKDKIGYELLGKASEIAASTGADIGVVVLGENLHVRAQEYLNRGAKKVYIPSQGRNALETIDAGTYTQALAEIAQETKASIILLGCTRRGKEIAGRVAHKLSAGCINDVNGMELRDGQLLCKRYALGGATVMTKTVVAPIAVISIMSGAFEAAQTVVANGEILEIDFYIKPSKVQVIEKQSKTTDAVDISEAETLVCVGMGIESQDNLRDYEELAKLVNGEIACSKPVATNQKWLPEERLIGISGKVCSPQLAFCMGIAGEVQFIVGIREANTIVAVNNNPNAPIFQVADYGIVGDLKEVMPKLISALKA